MLALQNKNLAALDSDTNSFESMEPTTKQLF